MTIYNWLKLENLKEGDLLDSSTRDSIILVGRHPVGWYNLEPDNLESKVKWALGRITTHKLVEVMEIQLSSHQDTFCNSVKLLRLAVATPTLTPTSSFQCVSPICLHGSAW